MAATKGHIIRSSLSIGGVKMKPEIPHQNSTRRELPVIGVTESPGDNLLTVVSKDS
jgi:hypothetical protein